MFSTKFKPPTEFADAIQRTTHASTSTLQFTQTAQNIHHKSTERFQRFDCDFISEFVNNSTIAYLCFLWFPTRSRPVPIHGQRPWTNLVRTCVATNWNLNPAIRVNSIHKMISTSSKLTNSSTQSGPPQTFAFFAKMQPLCSFNGWNRFKHGVERGSKPNDGRAATNFCRWAVESEFCAKELLDRFKQSKYIWALLLACSTERFQAQNTHEMFAKRFASQV